MARGPHLDLAQVLDREGVAQILAQRRPATARRPDDASRPSARRRAACRSCMRAACSFATRSRGRNGQSPGTLTTHSVPGLFAATQSSPARMPASGPAKSGTLSATTGRPKAAKRAGSPLALSTTPLTCGVSRASTRSQDRLAADADQRLVAAAHAAREPAREDEAERLNRHAPPPCAGACRSPPRRRRGPGRTRCGPRPRARRSACRARGRSASAPPCAQARRPRR